MTKYEFRQVNYPKDLCQIGRKPAIIKARAATWQAFTLRCQIFIAQCLHAILLDWVAWQRQHALPRDVQYHFMFASAIGASLYLIIAVIQKFA